MYSYGHRNVQGLAWDGKQRLWASEFGQNTWDELNQIKPGGNYGWPEVEGRGGKSGYIDPVAVWKTDEASPSGIAMAEGSVWMAGLRGQRLWRIPWTAPRPPPTPRPSSKATTAASARSSPCGGDKLWLVTSETDGRGSPEGGDDKILELEVK